MKSPFNSCRESISSFPAWFANLGFRMVAGEERIVGVMVESHLVEGRQDLLPEKPLTYGQSITDACPMRSNRIDQQDPVPRRLANRMPLFVRIV